MTDLQTILALPANEAVSALRSTAPSLPAWSELRTHYDSTQHAILDKQKYPDVITERGDIERVTRVVLPLQRLAVARTAELCFATPASRIYSPENDREREASVVMERLATALRLDSLNRQRAHYLFASCAVATLWSASPKPTRAYGFDSPVTLRPRTFSPMLGHRIYPFWDEWGDLIALSVEYTAGGRLTMETLTESERLLWISEEGQWSLSERSRHGLDRIPAVYIDRPRPVWGDASPLVEEMEFALSRNGNYLRRNAKPLLAVMHDKPEADWGQEDETSYEGDSNSEFRSIFELPKGSSMEYVTWDGATEALKFHYQTLRSLFFDSLQLPDWSHSEMKSTPMSGESRKQLYIDARLKVLDEAGALEVFLSREMNVLRSFASLLRPDLKDALSSLAISSEVHPYEISDERETIENLATAKGAGLISQREAIVNLGWSPNPERTLDEIRQEAALDASQQSL